MFLLYFWSPPARTGLVDLLWLSNRYNMWHVSTQEVPFGVAICSNRPHPPSSLIITTQPESWYSFYRSAEGGRLSRPRHNSKSTQPAPKAVYQCMGVNHGGTGGRVLHNMKWGTLMQIVPRVLSCFKISSTRLFALLCSKKLTNPITLTAYSLYFPKVHFQHPPNQHFWRGLGQKYR